MKALDAHTPLPALITVGTSSGLLVVVVNDDGMSGRQTAVTCIEMTAMLRMMLLLSLMAMMTVMVKK